MLQDNDTWLVNDPKGRKEEEIEDEEATLISTRHELPILKEIGVRVLQVQQLMKFRFFHIFHNCEYYTII